MRRPLSIYFWESPPFPSTNLQLAWGEEKRKGVQWVSLDSCHKGRERGERWGNWAQDEIWRRHLYSPVGSKCPPNQARPANPPFYPLRSAPTLTLTLSVFQCSVSTHPKKKHQNREERTRSQLGTYPIPGRSSCSIALS